MSKQWRGIIAKDWFDVPRGTIIKVTGTNVQPGLAPGVAPTIIYTIEREDGELLPHWTKVPKRQTTISADFVAAL